MGQVKLTGSLTVGPSVVSSSTFPSAVAEEVLVTTPDPKPSQVDTGFPARNLNSPSAFVALSGVPDNVAQANTLYVKTQAPMTLRLTFAQPSGPDLVSVVPINGSHFLEFPQDQYLKLIEAKGSGLIVYMASGQQ